MTVASDAPPRGHRREGRRARFYSVLVAITLAMHLPVALGVAEAARRLGLSPAWAPWALGVAWATLGVVLFSGRARAIMPDRKRSDLEVRLVDVPYFVHWCAALWALLPSIALTLLAPLVDLLRGAPARLPMGGYMWAYGSGLVVAAYGVLVRRKWVRVVEREVAVDGLPRAFEGLRIAHLSDLHIGSHTPRAWGLGWAAAANARRPDLAVVTGDLVTSGTEYHDDVADVIAALRAPRGVFASMGNHDYFGEGAPLVAAMRARGTTVLRNEGVSIEKDGATLYLAAIDDTWTKRADLEQALAARPSGVVTVLLAHDPNTFDAAADAGAHLVLSGHTHGGQVAVPFVARAWNLARLAYKYSLGFYRRGRSVLYVHPGLGTTGPPVRLGAAPEVTILVLRGVG